VVKLVAVALNKTDRAVLEARAKELYEWARRMILIQRATYQTRLFALRSAGPYLSPPRIAPNPRIRVQA